jgi:hypothetical protein
MHLSIIGFQRSGAEVNADLPQIETGQICYEILATVGQCVPEVIVYSTPNAVMVLCGWHSRNQLEDAMVAVRKWGRDTEVDFPKAFFHHGGLAAWALLRHALGRPDSKPDLQAFTEGFELSARFGLVGPILSQVYEFACDLMSPAKAG